MKAHFFSRISLITFLSLIFISGCSSIVPAIKVQEVKVPEKTISIEIVADEEVNPDLSGRPSPTVVRIYQLLNDDKFKDGDFFALYDSDKAVLSSDLISSEEILIKPGKRYNNTFSLHADTKFIGLLAAFQNTDNGGFKESVEVTPVYDRIGFVLKGNKVTLSE